MEGSDLLDDQLLTAEALVGFERILMHWRVVMDAERTKLRTLMTNWLMKTRHIRKREADIVSIAKALEHCDAFSLVDSDTCKNLIAAMWRRTYAAGDLVVSSNPSESRTDVLYAVISGAFEQRNSDNTALRSYKEFQFFGTVAPDEIPAPGSPDKTRKVVSLLGTSITCTESGVVWLINRAVYLWHVEGKQLEENRAQAASGMRHSWGQLRNPQNCFVLTIGDNRCGQLGLGKLQSTDPDPPMVATKLIRAKAFDQLQVSGCVCGYHSAYFESMGGELFSVGRNSIGQLALGHYKDVDRPRRIEALSEVCPVDENMRLACAGSVVYVWNNKAGVMVTWGDNTYGQLGFGECAIEGHTIGDHPSAVAPTPMPAMSDKVVNEVICGANFSYFFLANSDVYGLGHNASGQLALGHKRDVLLPEKIPELCGRGIHCASAGFNFAWFVTAADEVIAVGDNHFGQIGRGEFSRLCMSPQRVMGLQGQGVCLVSCGQYFVYALTKSGDVYSVGRNLNGQLGLGNTNHRSNPHECAPQKVKGLSRLGVVDIVCSAESALARTVNGSAFITGYSFGLFKDVQDNCYTPHRMNLSALFHVSPQSRFTFATGCCCAYFYVFVEKNYDLAKSSSH